MRSYLICGAALAIILALAAPTIWGSTPVAQPHVADSITANIYTESKAHGLVLVLSITSYRAPDEAFEDFVSRHRLAVKGTGRKQSKSNGHVGTLQHRKLKGSTP